MNVDMILIIGGFTALGLIAMINYITAVWTSKHLAEHNKNLDDRLRLK